MKSLFNRLAGVAVVGVVLYSCASIGRPEGGAIDETPPRFVGSTPAPGALNNNRKKVTIEFDEFIKLEKPRGEDRDFSTSGATTGDKGEWEEGGNHLKGYSQTEYYLFDRLL